MPARAATQTAAVEDGGPARKSDDDRASAPFTFGDYEVQLYEPVEGQRFILVQTISITDEDLPPGERIELILGFAQMLRSLFVEPAERMRVTNALARGEAELEDYFGLAREMAEYWDIEGEPVNREERRARERRPAKAVRPARPSAR